MKRQRSEYRSSTESKKPPKRVTRLVSRATRPSTMSNRPAPMMTTPASRNLPTASKAAAAMLITSPRNVRTLGWIFESASPRTISRMILLEPSPMARVNVMLFLDGLVDSDELDDLHLPDTTRDLDVHRIAHRLAEQAAANRRTGGNPAVGHVHVLAGNQFVTDLLVFVDVQNHNSLSQPDTVSRNLRHV